MIGEMIFQSLNVGFLYMGTREDLNRIIAELSEDKEIGVVSSKHDIDFFIEDESVLSLFLTERTSGLFIKFLKTNNYSSGRELHALLLNILMADNSYNRSITCGIEDSRSKIESIIRGAINGIAEAKEDKAEVKEDKDFDDDDIYI